MTTRIIQVNRDLGLLALTERDPERRRVIDAAYELIKDMTKSLERVKALIDSEAGEPLDDAIEIATVMLEDKPR